jgi:hypothetical protein
LKDLDTIIFCCFKETELMAYERIAPSYFPVEGFPERELPTPTTEEFNEDDAKNFSHYSTGSYGGSGAFGYGSEGGYGGKGTGDYAYSRR